MNIKPLLLSLLAAMCWGINVPLTKLILDKSAVAPTMMTALFCFGAIIGLLIFKLLFWNKYTDKKQEPLFERSNLIWLAATLVIGGVLAPLLLNLNIKNTAGSTASFFMNAESAATALVAYLFFGKKLGKLLWFAVAAITLADIVLVYNGGQAYRLTFAAVCVLGAFVLWGFDNNFVEKIAKKDPISILFAKNTIGGAVLFVTSFIFLHNKIPDISTAAAICLTGAVSYGFGIALLYLSIRLIGAARSAAVFGTAPFVGTFLSVIIFGEKVNFSFFAALLLMLAGFFLLMTEAYKKQREGI
jgi:drug/metabolite transporter (DMT)-like permease